LGHELSQLPPMQDTPKPQTFPHPPQFRGSVAESTQRLPQTVPAQCTQVAEVQV
jgi:hypothetical protein